MSPRASSGPLALAPGASGWRLGGDDWRPAGDLYAVFGDPVSHSLSPAIQTAALRARAIDAEFRAARIPAGSLRALRDAGGAPGLCGANVTAPLKAEAYACCDELTPEAVRAGAVNTLRCGAGRWVGHNTDVGGVARALAVSWPHPDPPRTALLWGTGGAARAAALALADWGVGAVAALGRGEAGRRAFQEWWAALGGPSPGVDLRVLPWTDEDKLPDAPLWVVAAGPGADPMQRLVGSTSGPDLLLDLRYGELLPDYPRRSGLRIVDGRETLVGQGGLSFAWWFGEPVPWPAMREAAGLSLR